MGIRAATALLPLLVLVAEPGVASASWPHQVQNGNLPVCTAAGDQTGAVAVSDGARGIVLAWIDHRGGTSWDLYAQRLSATGVPLWTAGGVAVCTAAGDQLSPAIATDGAGGAIITWTDLRGGATRDLYAQRIDSTGVAAWTANGVPVCTAANHQDTPVIVADDLGGAFVAWADLRNGATYDIYLQHLNASGALLWFATGFPVCVAAGSQTAPAMTTDGAGGLIVVWQDPRGGVAQDLYAQKVTADGTTQWADGIVVCDAVNSQITPAIVGDGAHGAIVTWADNRSLDLDVYAQRLNAAGTPLWGGNGLPIIVYAQAQQNPVVTTDGDGGAILAWVDYRSGANPDIFAQRVDAVGNPRWVTGGIPVTFDSNWQDEPDLVADGAGGAVIAWRDYRSLGAPDVFAQRLSVTGGVLWPSGGTPLCTATNDQTAPVLVADGTGGAVAAWPDARSGLGLDIYAQRIEGFGKLGSPEPGNVSVRDVPNDQGGSVRLAWDASWLDLENDPDLSSYDVYRSVPPNLAREALASGASWRSAPGDAPRGGDLLFTIDGAKQYAWEFVAQTTATHFLASYGGPMATTGDSIAGSNPTTSFLVVARNGTGGKYWLSAPAAGYSVDNLAPAAPTPFTGLYGAGSTHLQWAPNTEADVAAYRLYRGASPDFVGGPASLIGTLTGTGFVDAAGGPYAYKLSAVDVHGNESPLTALVPDATAGVGDAAAPRLDFPAPGPNPARGSSTLRYTLSRPGRVRLTVLDAAGRRLRVLRDESLESGGHVESFDLTDDAGRALPSGFYIVRLEAEGRVLTRRITTIR